MSVTSENMPSGSFQPVLKKILSGVVLLGLGAFVPLFIALYLQHEDPAYLWDWGGYYNMYEDFGAMIRRHDAWFSRLLATIRSDDYNLFPISFLAPFSLLFQSSRFGYICAVSLFYLLPTAVITTCCLITATAHDKKTGQPRTADISFLCIFVFFAIFYPFWAPTLRGLPDIVGLIPLGLATLLLIRSNFLITASWSTLLAFGVLTWLPFALRRWYAFSIVVMLALAFLLATASLFLSDNKRKVFFQIIKAYAVCGGLTGILLISFQSQLVSTILHTSYQEAYAGYHIAFARQLDNLYAATGPFYAVLFFSGVALAIRNKNTPVLFCAGTAILTFLFFSHTQALGIQHILPISFWAALTGGYAVLCLARNVPIPVRAALSVSLTAYGLLALSIVFLPQADNRLKSLFPFFTEERIAPLHVENMSEYTRLITELKTLTKNGDKFAVFASSTVLADSLLYEFDHSLQNSIAWTSQVDARDHLRLSALKAPLAIVTDPPITHLNQGSQQVITLPNDCILHHHDLGTAYEQVAGPFQLAEGHKAYIYHRTRPLSDADISWLQTELNHTYPAWKRQPATDMIE